MVITIKSESLGCLLLGWYHLGWSPDEMLGAILRETHFDK